MMKLIVVIVWTSLVSYAYVACHLVYGVCSVGEVIYGV